jgi:hypothetical protein
MNKKSLFLVFIVILLIVGTGIAADAQTPPPLPGMDISGYFVEVNGEPSGPYDTYGLKSLITMGHLTINTMVWKEGMATWVLAGAVAELAPLFAAAPVVSAPAPRNNGYRNYSSGQRFGTFLLNCVVPGLGSFAIMRDTRGGINQLGMALGGLTAFYIASSIGFDSHDNINAMGVFFYTAGGILFVVDLVYNIVRSSAKRRPRPQVSLVDPEAWNIAITPSRNGIETVSLAHTIKF